jgi:hypothetical protein
VDKRDKKDSHKDKSDKLKDKSRGRGRYRGGYRISKGRQGGRGKRDQESPDQDDNTKDLRSKHNSKDYTKDRISHDQCAFYRKKGYYQADYRQYKKH